MITNEGNEEETLSQLIFPHVFNAKTISLYNCTVVDLTFYSSDLKHNDRMSHYQ